METTDKKQETPKPWWQEISQPFVDLVHASRALWGVNLGYFLEGMVYFGILGYLAIYFSGTVFKGVADAEQWAHSMVGVLTAGITLSMFFLGTVADRWGVRRALLLSFALLIAGRALISAAPTVLGLPAGLWSPLHLATMGGILIVVIGYGMYQPAAYAAVRQFSSPESSGMGYAMLYALMNLGGWLPTFAFLLRDDDYAGLGIPGTFWVYTGFTALALVVTYLLLSRKTVADAIASAKLATEAAKALDKAAKSDEQKQEAGAGRAAAAAPARMPRHLWAVLVAILAAIFWKVPIPWAYYIAGAVALFPILVAVLPAAQREPVVKWIARHPLADAKFFFFIFALIPVQTLFTYNWLVLPEYISRAYEGWIGRYFEIASNANPILIFIFTPMIAALTVKAKVYRMMIVGTAVMAAPAFLLAIGPYPWTLGLYILLMTIGEAMWSPRFLQYAAEIAPEGRTGEYMGVAQLPWFLTKVLVPLLYSGYMMDHYCPAEGIKDTRSMWLIFGAIAIVTPILLVVAKSWVGSSLEKKGSAH
ncbi:MAG: MFS transporter [Deltaproteobacteria bacterium]|nr:MFS transporter [Deltaproteobacteria bacterium]